jgi:hypothetical protein
MEDALSTWPSAGTYSVCAAPSAPRRLSCTYTVSEIERERERGGGGSVSAGTERQTEIDTHTGTSVHASTARGVVWAATHKRTQTHTRSDRQRTHTQAQTDTNSSFIHTVSPSLSLSHTHAPSVCACLGDEVAGAAVCVGAADHRAGHRYRGHVDFQGLVYGQSTLGFDVWCTCWTWRGAWVQLPWHAHAERDNRR